MFILLGGRRLLSFVEGLVWLCKNLGSFLVGFSQFASVMGSDISGVGDILIGT